VSPAGLGEGPDKARFVSEMFSRIARRYDLMNGLMTFGMHHAWRRATARQTMAAPDGPALDLATGTGDLALELARMHPRRTIVGADFAPGMLAVASAKLRRANARGRVRLAAADALALPFRDRSFACVTSAFLLRNLADLKQGLREMRRVTSSGGRVVALEITQPTYHAFTPLFRFYFHRIVPRVGRLVSGDPEAYTYLPQSVDRFLTPSELAQLMEQVGLRGVVYRRFAMGTVTVHTGTA
jgi:demethylmenaquinone methyltransferase / 2-methoxy-6-polyprenyl-1,4-benzoquinol methylase